MGHLDEIFRTWSEEWPSVNNAFGNCEAGCGGGRLRAIYFTHFICCFITPVLNILIQFIRHVHFYWMSNHSYRTQSGQCMLILNMAFCLASMLFQIWSSVPARKLYLNWSILRKFWEIAVLLIYTKCLLLVICLFFWSQTTFLGTWLFCVMYV